MTKITKLLGWLVGMVFLFSGWACSHKQKIPKPTKPPQGRNFQGVWYSPQFEHMHLEQNGNKVTGIFYHGPGGKIEGTASGNLLKFKWIEPGNRKQMRKTMKGRGYFQLTKQEGKLELIGEWGYGKSRTGGGPWRAEYIRQLDDSDPLTLDEMER